MTHFCEQWPSRIVANKPGLSLSRRWQDNQLVALVENPTDEPIHVEEVILLEGRLPFPPGSELYGEGFQMLAQTGGTLANPIDLGRCPDARVYRLTQDAGFKTLYNLLLLWPHPNRFVLLGFTQCRRFAGSFRIWPDGRLQVILDCEGLPLAPGEFWILESLLVAEADDRHSVLTTLAEAINVNHPRLAWSSPPRGWCSWYHYYADVHEQDIRENLDEISRRFPAMRYVQIDDGYQAFMGDWLTPSDRFPSGMPALLQAIRDHNLEPALWVAPFIAESGSAVFRQHPDWFVKGSHGQPLSAESVTYGGWRCTPWYVLDGTHPEVQAHLAEVFRTLFEQWGVRYFKLDANFWGAIQSGRHHDPKATRIEAYRRGMQAIVEAVGKEAFLLGCNAPMWPSLGLVHGMRVSDDVERHGQRIRQIARESLLRGWQNDRLWWNDPDCIVLRDLPDQRATPAEHRFHHAAMVACGGLMLSGDRLSQLDSEQRQVLDKLLGLPGQGALVRDPHLRRAELVLKKHRLVCLLNWQDKPLRQPLPLSPREEAYYFWSGLPFTGDAVELAPYAGQVLEIVPAAKSRRR